MIRRVASTTLIALSCGLFQQTFAQVNYQPGYVVSLRGDTLKGYIDYRNWDINPEVIAFKSTPETVVQQFGPLDIHSFFVADDLYEGAIVNVETSPVRTEELHDGPELHIKTDTAFVRALVTGEKSLYIYRHVNNVIGKDEFYIRQGNSLELLRYKLYKRDYNGKTVLAANKTYANQLAAYLAECKGIQDKLRTVKYSLPPLVRLFNKYYACTKGHTKFEEKKEKIPLEIGVLAGGTRTQIKFNADYYGDFADYLVGKSFSPDLGFTGGIFFDLIRPRNHRKLSFNNELVYTSYKAERNNYKEGYTADSYDHYESRLKYSYIKLNTMLRYKYPVGRTYIFINAGISNGYMLSGSDSRTHVYKSGSFDQEHVVKGKLFLNGVNKYEFGLLAGLGVRYNRYAVEGRFERTDGMLDYVGLGARLNKLSLLLSYRLTK